MKHSNGFRYTDHTLSDCWGYATARTIQYVLNRKSEKRDPRLGEMVKINSHTWDRANKSLVSTEWEKNVKKTPMIYSRIHRMKARLEEFNRLYLSTLTEEQACAAFDSYQATGLNKGSWGCLAWWEVLPPGISLQMASNATGRNIFRSWWEGRELRTESYSPGGKKPSKTYQVAARI